MRPPKNLKIVFAFFLGIGLPSLLLGYLAWRGIRNDRALLERDRLNRCEAMAMRIQQRLNDQCRILTEFLTGRMLSGHGLDPNPETRHPLVEAVFTLSENGRVDFPFERLIYDNRIRPSALASFSFDAEGSFFRQGEQAEFIHRQYERAGFFYRRAAEEPVDEAASARIRCALARVLRKSGKREACLNAYEELASRFGHVPLADGLPARAAACLEMESVYREQGEFRKSFALLGGLYQDLLGGEWSLHETVCGWLAGELGDRIRKTASQAGPLQTSFLDSLNRWEAREAISREHGRKRMDFQERAESYFRHQGPYSPGTGEGLCDKTVIGGPDRKSGLCLVQRSPDRRGIRWGILLDSDYLRSDFLPSVFASDIGSESIRWTLKDESGNPLIVQDKQEKETTAGLVMKASFADRFPPWVMEFYEEETPLLRALFFSRQSLYVYIFMLIGCVLLFGLFLTYRTLRHEMEMIRVKTDFVTAVSHDFKNPLTSIRQLSEMLEAGRVPSETRKKQYYHVLLEQSDRLKRMVSNIVDYAKIEKGENPFTFEMINPGPLVHKVVAETQNRLMDTDFTIRAVISTRLPLLKADAGALEQVLNNLIDNAVKYSQEKRRVDVRARLSGREVLISVQDRGIGIAAKDRDRIFREFYRSDPPGDKKVQGTGLGLALARRIVQAHHGRIGVESTPGKGSTFTVCLPFEGK